MKRYIQLLLLSALVSLIFNACAKHYLSLQKIMVDATAHNVSINELDTIYADTISIYLSDSTSRIENKKYCIIPNPILALMSFTQVYTFCHKINNITISSYYDFNGYTSGESLTNLFATTDYNNQVVPIASFIDNYYYSRYDYHESSVSFFITEKPSQAMQKFKVTLDTDKGTFTAETPTFYWY